MLNYRHQYDIHVFQSQSLNNMAVTQDSDARDLLTSTVYLGYCSRALDNFAEPNTLP